MKKYLLFINIGGEMESPECSYEYYYICHGNTVEEAIKDWDSKVNKYMSKAYDNWEENSLKHENYMKRIIPNYQKYEERNGIWYCAGRELQVVELKEYEKDGVWKNLVWK